MSHLAVFARHLLQRGIACMPGENIQKSGQVTEGQSRATMHT